jgi:hypothetical protein
MRLLRPALVLAALVAAVPAAAQQHGHHADCKALDGLKKARCERHEKMFAKCHAIAGEAHHECDREFIVANPLDCPALQGDDLARCNAEREAVASCKDQVGRAFFSCVGATLRADPRH